MHVIRVVLCSGRNNAETLDAQAKECPAVRSSLRAR